jgi:hypothetical protein
MDQYQANRGNKGIKEYTQERKEQLKKKGVEDAVVIRDEVQMYTQNKSIPLTATRSFPPTGHADRTVHRGNKPNEAVRRPNDDGSADLMQPPPSRSPR